MDFQLSAQQREMVHTVRALTQDKIKPRAAKCMDGTFPWESLKELAEIGVLGMAVPEEYGGLGLPVLDTALVLEEVAKGCYPTAMALMGEVGVQGRSISAYAPERIKARIVAGGCTGECVVAVGMSGMHAATDVANTRTNNENVDDKNVVNGTKT